MNKTGAAFLQTVLNSALIIALLYVFFFVILGASGGFTALWNAGSFMSKIPGAVWAGIIIWIIIARLTK